MPTVTLPDGTEHSVDLEAIKLEEGQRVVTGDVFTKEDVNKTYVPREWIEGDEPKYVHKNTFDERFKSWLPREKAIDDDSIVSAVLEKHGEAFKSQDLEETKAQWTKAEVAPLRKELEKSGQRLERFMAQVVDSQIDAASSQVWKDEFATAPPGRRSWAQVNFNPENGPAEFRWDDDHGYVIAVKANGEPIASQNPTQARPYMSVLERFQALAGEDTYKVFARPPDTITTKNGADPHGGGGSSTSIKKRSDLKTTDDKVAFINEHGIEAFEALPM